MTRSLIVFAAIALAGCNFTPPDEGRTEKVTKVDRGVQLKIGSLSEVTGTPFVTLPIEETGDRGTVGSYSSSSGPIARNRLILNTQTGETRRILPDNQRELLHWVQLGSPEAETAGTRTRGPQFMSLYAAVVSDVRKDDKARSYDLVLGRFDTGAQVWAARGLEGVDEIWATPDQKLAVIVSTAGRLRFRRYDPQSLKLEIEREINP